MKTIMHVDMNSYFATVEQQTNPNLRGKPVGIIKAEGRGCVIAASVEAKKFGVKTGSTTWEARLKCPQTIFVPADMDKYLSITNKFIDILSEYSPSVEIFSIDELFMDISDVLTLYPGGSIQMAWEIKHKIKKFLGEWIKCSIGISHTKVLAKLASEMQKPDGLVILDENNYLTRTESVAVEEVCGIGRARTKWLKQRGAFTLGQARKLDIYDKNIEDLVWLKNDDPLVEISCLQAAKSVSRTYTTYKILNSKSEILKLTRNLVEEATSKLREMQMKGRTFCLSLDDFWVRKTIYEGTSDPLMIWGILEHEYSENPVINIRQAGVWITNLVANYQLPMDNCRNKLLEAVDKVNNRLGLFSVYPASLLGGELIRPEVTGYLGDKWYRFGKYGKN